MQNNQVIKPIDEVIAKERRQYFKEWRERNKDKVKQHNQNYWLKRAEKRQAEQAGGVAVE